MSVYDSAALLSAIRTLTYAPAAIATGSDDASLLTLLNLELSASLVPRLRRAMEEYLVTTADVTINSGQEAYGIPTRAIGASLRDLWQVRTDNSLKYLQRFDPKDIPNISGSNPTSSGDPLGWYLRGNNVVLFPSPAAGVGSIRMLYELRPNQLVAVASVNTVQSVDFANAVVTMTAAVPGAFTTATKCDFVKGTPHFDIYALDKLPTQVSGSTVSFASADIPTSLVAGDYVCLANQTAVPQIPFELQPILIQRAVCRLLETLGAGEKLTLAQARLSELEEASGDLLNPRVEGKPQIAINNYWF